MDVRDAKTTMGNAGMLRQRVAVMAVAAVLGVSFAATAMAQTPSAPDTAAKATKTVAKANAAPTGGGGESGLKSRVESLEEQLVDMQVVVGTLESMAKTGVAAPAARISSNGGGADAARVDNLETQVRALSAQVQQLSDQVRSMGGVPRRSDAGTALPPVAAAAPSASSANSFGTTSVASGNDEIGGLIENSPLPPVAGTAPAGAASPGLATAALPPPVGDSASPKQLYETAYGYMLQRDYGAAEVSFDDFLKRYPSDSLAGNAQYWLGESYFVRGQYKAAAGAFLKGYQTYAQSAKAPDSLLKLAMSLDRLGQKDAACSSYSELTAKFPSAPQSVKARAQSERQRVGCP